MSLKYHDDAFALLERRPRLVAEARTRMKAQEGKYGFRFPASVEEWFAHGGKGRLGWLLARHRDELREVAWNRLGAPLKVTDHGRRYVPLDDKLLVLVASRMWGYWAVGLEGDDPPVFWGDDIPGPGAKDHRWFPLTDRFSDFVRGAGWRYWKADRASQGSGPLVSDCMAALRPRELAFLLAHFEEGPSHAAESAVVEHQPGDWHYLFRRAGCYLWVWNQCDDDADDGSWFAGGDTPAALQAALRLLWHPGDFSTEDHWPICQGAAEAIWEETLANPPPFPGPGWEKVFGIDLVPLFAQGELLGSAQAPVLLPPHLDYLIDHLEEVERRAFPHKLTAHHFRGRHGQLFVVSSDYREKWAHSSWWLHARDPEALAELLRLVGNVVALTNLEARTEGGRQVLAAQRQAARRRGKKE